MGKLKVLMIGPGEPSLANSGLGIAAAQIAKHLSQEVEVIVIQPSDLSPDVESNISVKHITGLDVGRFQDVNVASDLSKINVRAKLEPYFYLVPKFMVIEDEGEEEKSSQEEYSEVKNELNAFTNSALIESRKVDFDVIYAHDWTAAPAALKIKEESQKPLITHFHSLDHDRGAKLERSWVYEVEKESIEKSDAVISVSDYTATVIEEEYSEPAAKKVYTVYNGTEPLVYSKKPKPFKDKIVLFVGRLTGQKGPSLFLEIAEEILKEKKDVRFVIAGHGDSMIDLVATAAVRGIGSKFHFTGFVDKEQLQDLYSMADVYCMPSVSEPFGLTALEAANAGLPMVLSKQSGASEVLTGAMTVDHWDVKGFAEHVLALLKSDKKRKAMIKTNKADLKPLTWENTATKILEVFNSIS